MPRSSYRTLLAQQQQNRGHKSLVPRQRSTAVGCALLCYRPSDIRPRTEGRSALGSLAGGGHDQWVVPRKRDS
jgi:hypothetical protein